MATKVKFWNFLVDVVGSGGAGWGVWVCVDEVEDRQSGDGGGGVISRADLKMRTGGIRTRKSLRSTAGAAWLCMSTCSSSWAAIGR